MLKRCEINEKDKDVVRMLLRSKKIETREISVREEKQVGFKKIDVLIVFFEGLKIWFSAFASFFFGRFQEDAKDDFFFWYVKDWRWIRKTENCGRMDKKGR